MMIGLPDADLGTRVHAIVQRETEAEASAENPRAFVAERLVAYKLPRTVEFTDQPLRDEAGRRGVGGRFFDRFRVSG